MARLSRVARATRQFSSRDWNVRSRGTRQDRDLRPEAPATPRPQLALAAQRLAVTTTLEQRAHLLQHELCSRHTITKVMYTLVHDEETVAAAVEKVLSGYAFGVPQVLTFGLRGKGEVPEPTDHERREAEFALFLTSRSGKEINESLGGIDLELFSAVFPRTITINIEPWQHLAPEKLLPLVYDRLHEKLCDPVVGLSVDGE